MTPDGNKNFNLFTTQRLFALHWFMVTTNYTGPSGWSAVQLPESSISTPDWQAFSNSHQTYWFIGQMSFGTHAARHRRT
jgi:hypothetical protein